MCGSMVDIESAMAKIRWGKKEEEEKEEPPHTTTIFRRFFRDHPGEPVPEANFWTLWCKGKINSGRHTDHPAGRHSIRTNQCPPQPSPIFTEKKKKKQEENIMSASATQGGHN